MSKRTIPWGTVIAGGLALGAAVLVALTEMAGVSIPLAGAGPGAVIVVGLLILVTGLVVVLRSNRAAHAGGPAGGQQDTPSGAAAPSPASSPAVTPDVGASTRPVATAASVPAGPARLGGSAGDPSAGGRSAADPSAGDPSGAPQSSH